MKYYYVTFRWYDTDIYCANIAHAPSKAAVERFYTDRYGWCAVRECPPYDLQDARERGKPIIEIE